MSTTEVVQKKRGKSGEHYDVVIIGGGASGMMAAGRAAERGKRVLLLEKNKELGKKLGITGGGRCNITNAESDLHTFLDFFGEAKPFLYSPASQFWVEDTYNFFQKRGLPIVEQAKKRCFPKTERATDVVKVMQRYASQSGVTIRTGVKVRGFVVEHEEIQGVKTTEGTFWASQFILAAGGFSHQETGASIEWINWVKDLGHKTHKPGPDIVPLKADDTWVHALSGTTLSFMKITFTQGTKKVQKKGKLLFTHFGLSGPLILNAAHQVKELLKAGPVATTVDLCPDTEVGTVRKRVLATFDEHKNKALRNVLKEFLPNGMDKGFIDYLPKELLDTKVHSVSKEDRERLADLTKALPLTVTGTMGYDWAVVSDGGVDLTEVDMKTMASKLHPNLFFTGDVLHINRPSGGFSLQLCWTTGWVAGSHV